MELPVVSFHNNVELVLIPRLVVEAADLSTQLFDLSGIVVSLDFQ